MKIIRAFRSQLGLKLFLSYLVVIGVGIIALMAATPLVVPGAFERHIGGMQGMMDTGNMMGDPTAPQGDLFINFGEAVRDAVTLAGIATSLSAIVVSLFISRRIVARVRDMTVASERISQGNYKERVKVPIGSNADELDELDQLAINFNQMSSKLERVETMRRQLIGDVAHELRTPLTAIKGSVEGLIDGVLPPGPETLQQIQLEANRLERLANDLQELSRIESGALGLEKRSVQVPQLIKVVVERFGRLFKDKGVHLETQIETGLPPVMADEGRIGQVLANLLGNALQYTDKGGSVVVGAKSSRRDLQFFVRDSGIGISAEHLTHIFDRFYRVDKSRSRAGGGSGIGLTIARQLVEAHGGKIWAQSPGPGQGSTFWFTLKEAI